MKPDSLSHPRGASPLRRQRAAARQHSDTSASSHRAEVVRAKRRERQLGQDELWKAYKRDGTKELRDQLIVRYSPVVKYVAGRIASGLPRHVDQSDLVGYGTLGLIDAIEKFQPDRNVKFETYAVTRIKGAILDQLRAVDWVPRSVRAKARSLERASSKLEMELGRSPTDAELALEMHITEEELGTLLGQVSLLGVAALDDVLRRGDASERTTMGELLADQTPGPVALYEIKETREILAGALDRLGERERAVMLLYYYEGLTLKEIGEVFGITESRACQIHAKAMIQLRHWLADTD